MSTPMPAAGPQRRGWIAAVALAFSTLPLTPLPLHAQPPQKVLRVAFNSAESTLDPARITDVYSRTITAHIFEALYGYDPLARPYRIVPLTAAAMPEVSADFRTWTIRIRPGIFFAGDPAFGGKPRELVAQDYVYAFKRVIDPALSGGNSGAVIQMGCVGLSALREDALKNNKPFDYDTPVAGLRALDRYTLRIELENPRPRLVESLADSSYLGAVAREVVAHYGDRVAEHPVGTGPFRLQQWRRTSLIVLERNPDFREMLYDAQPEPDDAQGQEILARFKGRRLPMVDRVEVAIIEESQPRWLAFLNGQLDGVMTKAGSLPLEFANIAMPGGELAPNLAKRGITGVRAPNPDIVLTLFNMEDPALGGLEPARVALRRAISLAYDTDREVRIARRGQAVVAHSPLGPFTTGYDPAFRSEMGEFNRPKAKALLDLYGWVDRNGDGWREQPDGSPLELRMYTQPEQINRTFDELWKKSMDAVGIRMSFVSGQWAAQLKLARSGQTMLWMLGSSADVPDGQSALERWYGPQSGSQNLARFKLPAFDAIYERLQQLPNGPERDDLFLQAKRLAVAYMPYKVQVHRVGSDLWHPWLTGYRKPLFWNDWWQWVDIDPALRESMKP
jgi:ABC-type transport system substrate-binding protein